MKKGLIIGIDIGGTNIRCALVSKDKGVLSYTKERVHNKDSKEAIVKQLTQIIGIHFSQKVKGIGVGVPAIVDLEKGMLYEAFNLPGWKKVHLKAMLEKRYKVPVRINNDANCFALGEKCFGSAKKYKNIVGVILGTGFGAGIIINNMLYCGKNCAAGEFGRVLLKDKTVEDYCSGKFFINKYNLPGENLYAMAKQNNTKGLKAFKEFGDNLGLGVSAVINSIDPEIIVLGGSVSKAYKLFKEPFLASLKKHIYHRVYQNMKIKISTNEKIGVLGAASLFFSDSI